MKLTAYALVVEVTRRCNMHCKHCLRGTSEKEDINRESLRAALKQFDRIGCITFSGGEPTLNLEAIRDTLELCKELGITVGNFYLVTNGKMTEKTRDELIDVCDAWYAYCDDNELSALTVSQDMFHEPNWVFVDEMDDLFLPYFKSGDKRTDFRVTGILRSGRAKRLKKDQYRFLKPADTSWRQISAYRYDDELVIEEGTLYLSANGLFYPNCDLSYEQMREATGLSPKELVPSLIRNNVNTAAV